RDETADRHTQDHYGRHEPEWMEGTREKPDRPEHNQEHRGTTESPENSEDLGSEDFPAAQRGREQAGPGVAITLPPDGLDRRAGEHQRIQKGSPRGDDAEGDIELETRLTEPREQRDPAQHVDEHEGHRVELGVHGTLYRRP